MTDKKIIKMLLDLLKEIDYDIYKEYKNGERNLDELVNIVEKNIKSCIYIL